MREGFPTFFQAVRGTKALLEHSCDNAGALIQEFPYILFEITSNFFQAVFRTNKNHSILLIRFCRASGRYQRILPPLDRFLGCVRCFLVV